MGLPPAKVMLGEPPTYPFRQGDATHTEIVIYPLVTQINPVTLTSQKSSLSKGSPSLSSPLMEGYKRVKKRVNNQTRNKLQLCLVPSKK
jgi:hypothetical protein